MRRGLRRAEGIARSEDGPNQGGSIYVPRSPEPRPIFGVSLPPWTPFSSPDAPDISAMTKVDRGFWIAAALDKYECKSKRTLLTEKAQEDSR